jgi:GT2 family glycosyltransferase
MTEDLTVLIANQGRMDNLRPCLKSIFDPATSGQTSLRAIVGFNFQGDSETPRMLAREFPQVEQLRAPASLGYCRAYNQLLARSTGRYVLFLDDDTLLGSGAIDGMVRFMDVHPEVGIAGCRTTNPDGSYQTTTTGLMYTIGTEVINVFRPAAFWRDGIDESTVCWKPVGWLNGHFMMARAKAIKQVGGLDERFYTYQCEADWCLRIRRAGWTVAYVPDFEVMHIGGMLRVPTYKSLVRSNLNRYYFIRKHYGSAAYHAFRLIMSAGSMLRLLKFAAIWLVRPQRRPQAGPMVAGYLKTVLRGATAHPEDLPEELRRENATAALFQLGVAG